MTAPRALIAEDEPLLAAALEQELARAWPELAIAVRVGDGLSAVRQALALLPDILFLDIRMPGRSGLEAALELADAWPQGQPLPALVFVTAYDQYAVQAFEAQAVDYLLKPVSFEKFVAATNRVREFLENKHPRYQPGEEYFFMNVAHKLHKIFYHDILFLEGYKDYTKLHLAGSSSPLLVLHNLKYFEDLLNPQEFIRIHRSYIVPIRRVNTVARKTVTILTHQLPVSDNYRERFFSIVERYAR